MMEQTQISIRPTKNKLDWPEVILEAEASNEPFTNMNIVTAKSELLLMARSQALIFLTDKGKIYSDEAIDKLAEKLVDSGKINVREHAYIKDDRTIVCLDVDVIDDDSIWTALDYVYEAVSNGGVWAAKEPIKYKWIDLV